MIKSMLRNAFEDMRKELLYLAISLYGKLQATMFNLWRLSVVILSLILLSTAEARGRKNIILDTDFFSDVDDAAALLLAATMPNSNLLGVNVNYPSTYSALAVSAILAHYRPNEKIPIGLRGPFTNETFFDDYFYELGEYASKVTYHWSNNSIPWSKLDEIWHPVELYRKLLAEQEDGSATIASVGFFENLSGLLNSTADRYSPLSGRELIVKKVSQLVVMGGQYPSGSEYNFFGDNPLTTAHVINTWPSLVPIVFSGTEMGADVQSGGVLTKGAPEDDPVRSAYRWYVGYGQTRASWDPLTVLYAVDGLGRVFEYGNEGLGGYNHVFANGSNEWVFAGTKRDQKWLRLKVDNATAAEKLDELYLNGANSR